MKAALAALLCLGARPALAQGSDDCLAAQAIAGTGLFAFDTTLATTDGAPGAPCPGGVAILNDVWWIWLAPSTDAFEIETCGLTTLDTALAVHDGNCAGPVVVCDDDACGSSSSRVVLDAFAGHSYTIRLGSPDVSGHGLGQLSIARLSVPQPFCFGDGADPGHTTACPCANFGAVGRGCASSFVPAGALLSFQGSIAADNLVLTGSGLPATATGVYFQQDAAGDQVLFDGVSCAGGTALRLCTRASVGGASSFPIATDGLTLSQAGGVAPGSGLRRYYSLVYRNAAPFCTSATANVSNGLIVDW